MTIKTDGDRIMKIIPFFIAIGLGLSSCTSTSGILTTYDLTAPDTIETAQISPKMQILVSEPSALKTYDSQSIVIRSSMASLEYLSNAQWSDRLPKITQARLMEAFENSGQFSGVGRPGDGLLIDHHLITTIRAFDIITSGTKTAHVRIYAKLLNEKNGVVLASKTFSASLPTKSDQKSFIGALNMCFQTLSREIVNWSTEIINKKS
jgi:cholesterol transport system auxiliary component